MAGDRIDMLKQLTKMSDDTIDLELFKTYIPKFYPQIYSFYSLLNSCFIKYSNIKFEKPIVIDDSIAICFSISKSDYKTLSNEIKAIDNGVKYLRGYMFTVKLSGPEASAKLTFTKSR